jgi:hypothetical protein
MRMLGLAVVLLAPLRPERVHEIPWLKALIQRAPLVSRYLV